LSDDVLLNNPIVTERFDVHRHPRNIMEHIPLEYPINPPDIAPHPTRALGDREHIVHMISLNERTLSWASEDATRDFIGAIAPEQLSIHARNRIVQHPNLIPSSFQHNAIAAGHRVILENDIRACQPKIDHPFRAIRLIRQTKNVPAWGQIRVPHVAKRAILNRDVMRLKGGCQGVPRTAFQVDRPARGGIGKGQVLEGDMVSIEERKDGAVIGPRESILQGRRPSGRLRLECDRIPGCATVGGRHIQLGVGKSTSDITGTPSHRHTGTFLNGSEGGGLGSGVCVIATA